MYQSIPVFAENRGSSEGLIQTFLSNASISAVTAEPGAVSDRF